MEANAESENEENPNKIPAHLRDEMELNPVIAVIGSRWVGKSAFIKRFLFNEFKNTAVPAIGKVAVSIIGYSECRKRVVVGNVTMNISMWDTIGTHKYSILPKFFYTKAHCIIFMYSCIGKVGIMRESVVLWILLRVDNDWVKN